MTALDVQRGADGEIVSLSTCQWSWGGLFDGKPVDDVCLVRSTRRGTPGPTLCGRDRFDRSGPGWSMNGGIGGNHQPCAACVAVRDRDFAHLPVDATSMWWGLFAGPAASEQDAVDAFAGPRWDCGDDRLGHTCTSDCEPDDAGAVTA